MRIAIVGYGKMGKMVAAEARSAGHSIVAVIDPWCPAPEVTALHVDARAVSDADAVIDFSHPACVADNLVMYARLGIPAVIGTTGWYDELDQIKEAIEPCDDKAIVYSGNFSLGVAAFLSVVKEAGRVMNSLSDYDVSVEEVHHVQKLDAPSGTAMMVASALCKELDRKDRYVTADPGLGDILITSERVGAEPGFHEVVFKGPVDEIRLSHHAFSREGFAKGALKAASWISDGKKGLFTMDDFMHDILGAKNNDK